MATQQVNDLPLNGRNFTQLLSLTPGVSTANTGQNASGGLSSVALGSSVLIPVVNGQTSRSNYFLTDGLDGNDVYYNGYTVPPIIDAIQCTSIHVAKPRENPVRWALHHKEETFLLSCLGQAENNTTIINLRHPF